MKQNFQISLTYFDWKEVEDKHRFRLDGEECYFRIPDINQDSYDESELPFFNSNLMMNNLLDIETHAHLIDKSGKLPTKNNKT